MTQHNGHKQSVYFPDGKTRDGFIRDVPDYHGALRFTYRPLTAVQRDELRQCISDRPPATYNQAIQAMLARHVQSWDATDDAGKPLAITPAVIACLHPALYDRLYFVVSGLQPSDPVPGATSAETGSFVDELLAADRSGQSIGQSITEADQKN